MLHLLHTCNKSSANCWISLASPAFSLTLQRSTLECWTFFFNAKDSFALCNVLFIILEIQVCLMENQLWEKLLTWTYDLACDFDNFCYFINSKLEVGLIWLKLSLVHPAGRKYHGNREDGGKTHGVFKRTMIIHLVRYMIFYT